MPIFLRFNNYINFIEVWKIVRNIQNIIETRGNLCTKPWPLVNNFLNSKESLLAGGLRLCNPLVTW